MFDGIANLPEGQLSAVRTAAEGSLRFAAALLSLVIVEGAACVARASPAEDAGREGLIASAGTVIIGGTACQLVALDDGRFVALHSGAIPQAPLTAKARVRIVAEPAQDQACAHAQSVFVKEFHRLPDLVGGASGAR